MKRSLAMLGLSLVLASGVRAAEQQEPLNQIYLEVSALSALYDLEATPEQMKALAGMAGETVSKKGVGDAHPGKPYRSALVALREAFIKNDDDEIGDCQERLATIEEKMENPPNPVVGVTEGAKKKLGEAVRLFTAGQIAEYVSARADEVPDPAGELVDAIDSLRGKKEKAYEKGRDELAEEIAMEVSGVEGKGYKSLHDDVIAFLDKVHGLSDDDVKGTHEALEKEARHVAESPDPLAVMTHWIQRDVAELLSNPQLPAALAARAK